MVQSQSVTQLALFDYAALDTETRIVVQQRTAELREDERIFASLMRQSVERAWQMGEKLADVQARLRGKFLDWLGAEFPHWSQRSAYNFISVYRSFEFANFANLEIGLSAAYLLAAPSTLETAREEAIERAEQGESISYTAAREIVFNHRPPREIIVPRTEENSDLIGDGIDDVWDPPMESAQSADRLWREEKPPSRITTGLMSSATPEWYTPRHIIDRVARVFGAIDLDPCSNSHEAPNVPALHHFTAADDGLAQIWHGRVYMNPPYGDEIPAWVERLIRAYQESEIAEAIALLPARTDTAWFQPLYDYALCFVRGRLRFSNSENSAPFPSVVAYLGPDFDLFRNQFEDIGRCGRFT